MEETTGKLIQCLILIVGSIVLFLNGVRADKKNEISKEWNPSLSLQSAAGACAFCMLCWTVPCMLYILLHEVFNCI